MPLQRFVSNQTLYADNDPSGYQTLNGVVDAVNGLSTPITASVSYYGARGDGVHDDSAAFQAALTASVGKSLFVPPGRYVITQNLYIPSGTELWGAGPASQIVMGGTWAAIPTGTAANAAYILLSNAGGAAVPNTDTDISVHDLWLEGNASHATWGLNGTLLRFIGMTRCRAYNLTLRYNNLGVGIVGCTDWVVRDVVHFDATGFVTSVWWGSKRGFIKNIIGHGLSGYGGGVVQINAMPNGFGIATNVVTEDIDVSGISWSGEPADGSSVQIFPLDSASGNIVRNVRIRGVTHNETSHAVVNGGAITIVGSCQDITIDEIEVTGMSGPRPAVHINYEGSTSYYPKNIRIAGISFVDSTITNTNPIVNVDYANGVTISGVMVRNSTFDYGLVTTANSLNVMVTGINCPGASISKFLIGAGTTLADFEQGTWTPAVRFGGASTGITYNSRPAIYTRVGRLVYVQADISMLNKGSATGAVTIAGLPFTATSAITGPAQIDSYYANMSSVTAPPVLKAAEGGTTIIVMSSNQIALDDTNFTNSTFLRFAGWYSI